MPMGHDACGVGFIADTGREPSHNIVVLGVSALRHVAHRGAPASLGAVDRCGVMTAIPRQLVPAGHALGMLFIDRSDRSRVEDLVERELRAAGAGALAEFVRAVNE